ncbi:MAG: FHA domain-containing protein [Planctomycetaceae bacterium]|nr:FHA domain-containing protein [Planctomycetaceae bacterium]
MNCPHCGFSENLSEAVCCGGCGKRLARPTVVEPTPPIPRRHVSEPTSPSVATTSCEIQLEVRCGVATPDAPCSLFLRVTNQKVKTKAVEVSIDSPSLDASLGTTIQALQLGGHSVQTLLPVTFQASLGHHAIQFQVDVDGTRFYGVYGLDVSKRGNQVVNVHGHTINHQGDYDIGDKSYVTNVTLSSGAVSSASEFIVVPLEQRNATQQVRKQRFRPQDYRPEPGSCLALRLEYGENRRRLLLYGGQSQVIGRRGDLRLVCHPSRDPHEKNSESISREHAVVEFKNDGVYWRELSQNGTSCVAASGRRKLLGPGDRQLLSSDMVFNPADVLPLRVRLFVAQVREPDIPDYERFVTSELRAQPAELAGAVQAVGIQRQDQWASQEEYLLLQHSVLIGRAEDCAIQIDEPTLGPHHAYIHFLGGSFWLEMFHPRHPVTIDGHPHLPHHLVPLLPRTEIRLGNLRISPEMVPKSGKHSSKQE